MKQNSITTSQKQPSKERAFTRRNFISTSLKAGAAAWTTGLLPSLTAAAEGRYNVLFIMVDDLRPMLGCYGHTEMHTPNIDRLAQRGTLFNRAYCQYPLCNPSRASMITGLRPDTTGVVDNSANFRTLLPSVITLPQHFKTHKYHTQSIGRVLHIPELQNDELAWSARAWAPVWVPFDIATTPSWQALDVADDEPRDGQVAYKTMEVLAKLQNKPFFLAVGLTKPHLPYNVPRKYFDLYDSQTFNLHSSAKTPKDVPRLASTHWTEIKNYQDFPRETLSVSEEKIQELTRAYAASTSYTDALIGLVLKQLDNLNLTENTVVVLVGDHGYHLGEHRTWSKNTLFEVGVRSPLLISVPGQHPGKTDALTELVDIYPTLCDACQLPIPSQLEGLSLMPIIEQPESTWKAAAFSQIRRGNVDAYSMRTEHYRYAEWGTNGKLGLELYDYRSDPYETVNIATLPENAELIANLSERLHAGWQAALPEEIPTRVPQPRTLKWDVNDDGIVDINDLILVSNSFGAEHLEHPKVDVNQDGNVNIIDLLLIASHLGESSNAEAPSAISIPIQHADTIEKWINEARLTDNGSAIFRKGIANLEILLNTVIPNKSVLLSNFPNPFNPETWIPYDLAEDADVKIDIYNLKGESVRQLKVGFQTAGTYRTQAHAAYWDGRNSSGELVASGTYYYTLTAQYSKFKNHFRATRRMVIVK